MNNIIVHITFPKGLALVDGRTLHEDVTFDIISVLSPYYTSVDTVKLAGGQIIRKVPEITIGCQIYQSSQEVDLICPVMDFTNTTDTRVNRFVKSRLQWVTAHAARELILSQMTLIGGPASHVLANFSVQRSRNLLLEGAPARLRELEDSLKLYDTAIRSGGITMPGGHAKSGFGAKGVYDWIERTPARTWMPTGLGANATSWDFGSPTGGRGKPVKFFSAPFYSPPLVNLRAGIFQGTYPLVIVSAYPTAV